MTEEYDKLHEELCNTREKYNELKDKKKEIQSKLQAKLKDKIEKDDLLEGEWELVHASTPNHKIALKADIEDLPVFDHIEDLYGSFWSIPDVYGLEVNISDYDETIIVRGFDSDENSYVGEAKDSAVSISEFVEKQDIEVNTEDLDIELEKMQDQLQSEIRGAQNLLQKLDEQDSDE